MKTPCPTCQKTLALGERGRAKLGAALGAMAFGAKSSSASWTKWSESEGENYGKA